MGYQTDFVGYLHVQPALNETEVALLNDVAHKHLWGRAGLRKVDDREAAVLALKPAPPRGWSNWEACPQGCCLSYDGGDKANAMVPWLKHLMATYLVPGATAVGQPGFEEFTGDHVLNGMVVGSRRDTRELYSITVRENEVEVELLWPGVPEWSDYPRLGYQAEIDRFRKWAAAYRLEDARQKAQAQRATLAQQWDEHDDV
ncbi:MAG: hypothetical protein ACRDPH_01580 [Marmoricola sp.]